MPTTVEDSFQQEFQSNFAVALSLIFFLLAHPNKNKALYFVFYS
jgi:hypothetical protein